MQSEPEELDNGPAEDPALDLEPQFQADMDQDSADEQQKDSEDSVREGGAEDVRVNPSADSSSPPRPPSVPRIIQANTSSSQSQSRKQ